MKKYLFTSITMAAAALLVTSCNDGLDNGLKTGEESTVTFTAQLPSEIGTRAFADGKTATQLQYAVYEAGQTTPLAVFGDETTVMGTATMEQLKQKVSLKLTTGKTYDVIFWADDASANKPYTFDPATQTVKINYSKVYTNSDNCDAFFRKYTVTVSGNMSEDVALYRPFAQINIGTDDFEAAKAAGLNLTQTVVKANAGDELNLSTGEMGGTVTARTFKMKAIPTDADGAFPVTGYKYLSMNYLPIGSTKETIDLTFGYNGKSSYRTFTNVPVQRNFRTNIYGSLLTNSVDFNVVIEPAFSNPAFAHEVVNVSTLAALKTAVANQQSANAEGTIVISGTENETFDLGDLSISNQNDIFNTASNNLSLLSARDNSTLTIKSGTYQAKANDCYAIDVQDNARLVIEDGTFKGNVNAIYVKSGSAEIKGGTFEVQKKYSADYPDDYVLDCADGTRSAAATITVTGGKFIGFNPSYCRRADGSFTNFVAEGYAAVEAGATTDGRTIWTVVSATEAKTIEALESALGTTKSTVTLGTDLGYSSSISLAQGSSLILKNNATLKSTNDDSNNINTLLTVSKTGVTLAGNGTLMAAPNRATHPSAVLEVRNGGTVNIKGDLTFEADGGSKANYAIKIISGTANIYSGYFHTVGGATAQTTSELIYLESGYASTFKANLNIYGGVFECDGDATYLINCQDAYKSKCTVKIMGGTFVGFNPADNTAEGSGTNYVAAGYKSVKTTYNGKEAWTVVKQ